MSNTFLEIQENLFEYFVDIDDKTIIKFIDCFVYENGTDDIEVSKLIDKFLKDNGLVNAHINYIYDLNHPEQFFRRSNLSEIEMIQNIKNGLLSLAFNRFRLANPKPKSNPLVDKLNKQDKKDLKMVIEGCERHNNDLLDDEQTTREMFDEEEANELIDERKRLAKLFKKVLKIIK